MTVHSTLEALRLQAGRARDAVLVAARRSTSAPRPLPDFVILGAQKSGTSSLYARLIAHPRVLRVVALSGGYSRPDACVELAKNRGIIASFSRALLEDLRHQMSDAEFNASLGSAIDDIYTASTKKTG